MFQFTRMYIKLEKSKRKQFSKNTTLYQSKVVYLNITSQHILIFKFKLF